MGDGGMQAGVMDGHVLTSIWSVTGSISDLGLKDGWAAILLEERSTLR